MFINVWDARDILYTQDAIGNKVTRTHDALDRLVAIMDPLSRLAGRQNLLVNELGFATTTSFDAGGRPVTVLDANNRVNNRLSAGIQMERPLPCDRILSTGLRPRSIGLIRARLLTWQTASFLGRPIPGISRKNLVMTMSISE